MTEDCARRRVHASNRRSRLLASRRNAGRNVRICSLSGLLPALNISPFLFRPPSGATFPPGEGVASLPCAAAQEQHDDPDQTMHFLTFIMHPKDGIRQDKKRNDP